MNTQNIELLIKYILGVAGQQEDFGYQELGPIHVLKYIYLADLAHAEKNSGQTFTGIPWKFHNFGPWSYEACELIKPTALSAGAIEKKISHPKYENDFTRWRLCNDALVDGIEKRLPLVVISGVKRAIRNFGSDTSGLLHYVYTTKPMLSAAPGEQLDFSCVVLAEFTDAPQAEAAAPAPLSTKQQRLKREKMQHLKEKIQKKFSEARINRKLIAPQPAPRYDDIFFDGQKALDHLAGSPIVAEEKLAYFSDDLWKSVSRYDPEIS